MYTTSARPRPAPQSNSASAPRLASLSTCTGRPRRRSTRRCVDADPARQDRRRPPSRGAVDRPGQTQPDAEHAVAVDPGPREHLADELGRAVDAVARRSGRRRARASARRGSRGRDRRPRRADGGGRSRSRRARPAEGLSETITGGRPPASPWRPVASLGSPDQIRPRAGRRRSSRPSSARARWSGRARPGSPRRARAGRR